MGEIFIDCSAYLLARRGSKRSLRVVLDGFASCIGYGQPVDPDMLALVVRHAKWRLKVLDDGRAHKAKKGAGRWQGQQGVADLWREFLSAVKGSTGQTLDAALLDRVARQVKKDLASDRYSAQRRGPATPNLFWYVVALEVYDLHRSGLSVDKSAAKVSEMTIEFGGRLKCVSHSTAMAAYKRHVKSLKNGDLPDALLVFD